MTVWAAVVLAAGKGTRMNSALPKVLHPLCGQPMAQHVLDAVRAAGVTRTTLVVGHAAGRVRAALGGDVQYVEQARQRGTGHALLQARRAVSGAARSILVLYGDTPLISSQTLRSLMERHRARRLIITGLPDCL
ncbi:MAG: NTP transferase domain-containing protein, partial [Chloroflexota bacterium]